MFGPLQGIDTTDGNNAMTALQNSVLVGLARQAFGTPTGDPLTDMLQTVIMASSPTAAELVEVGFGTNALFDLSHLRTCLARRQAFTVTSLATKTVYVVSVQQHALDGSFRAIVQIYNEAQPSAVWYKMTLARADNGSIRVIAGW